MTVVLRGWSPHTAAKAEKTLQEMRRNVAGSLTAERVLLTARNIAAAAGERDEVTQARMIRQWTCDRFKFLNDPLGVELLETPNFLLGKILQSGYVQGDCDDAAALTAGLLKAIGIPCTFVAMAFTKAGPWAHVMTIAHPRDFRRGGQRVDVEQDITRPLGMDMPHPARTLTVEV